MTDHVFITITWCSCDGYKVINSELIKLSYVISLTFPTFFNIKIAPPVVELLICFHPLTGSKMYNLKLNLKNKCHQIKIFKCGSDLRRSRSTTALCSFKSELIGPPPAHLYY